MLLQQSCDMLTGVGPTIATKLAKCGVRTLADVLFHLPYRYQDRTRITAIGDLLPNHYSVIIGHIQKTEMRNTKRPSFICYVEDSTGILKLRFFHFNKHQYKTFQKGKIIRAFGEVHQYAYQLEMIHPEYQLLEEGEECTVEEHLTPIYATTQGLSQAHWRKIIKHALTVSWENLLQLEWMSDKEREGQQFYSIPEALKLLHNPPPDIALSTLELGQHPAIQRLIFDELLAHRLSIQFARQQRSLLLAPVFNQKASFKKLFLNQLPFTLTQAQDRVSKEIENDLVKEQPMLRLVQGDVGSGKTVVAALASLQAIANGYQVAIMVPTELLSEQHASQFISWFTPLGLTCRQLSSKTKLKEKKHILTMLAQGECHVLIGTHALFQEKVSFRQLGLIIIDEQHRFGVTQRLLLEQKGQQGTFHPHQLLMTATPIPRTLAMAHFSHLDISVIDELPPFRKTTLTSVHHENKRESIIQRLRIALQEGRQAYWVCTLIETSEKRQCMAAIATADKLKQQLLDVNIGILHGKMKPLEKEDTMIAFKRKEIDLLVATTVIEVGVDVPNASLMIIENAERLGLAQLHQLRGRIGRGHQQSHCLLLYQAPLSSLSAERLQIMRSTENGFIIAEKDLQLRGAGEILGVKQTGYYQFKLANLQRDKILLSRVNKMVSYLMEKNIELAKRITRQWLGSFEHFLRG